MASQRLFTRQRRSAPTLQDARTFQRAPDVPYAAARKPQELPRLRTALFTEEYNDKPNPVRNGLMRVMLFTMMLLQHALIARASLLTDFCPTVDAIRLPDEKEQWDADGFPQFFTLELTNWKGNTKRRRQVCASRRGAGPAAQHAALRSATVCAQHRRAALCCAALRIAPKALRAWWLTAATPNARCCVSNAKPPSRRRFTSSATPSTRSSAPWLR